MAMDLLLLLVLNALTLLPNLSMSDSSVIINQLKTNNNDSRTLRIGYITARSFFGSFSTGALLGELIFRAANDFWSFHLTGINVEILYAEASVTAEESHDVRCTRVAEQLVSQDAHIIIGPATSACSEPSATIFGRHGVPQISQSATSEALSNKTRFPTFFRIPPSDANQANVLAELVGRCGWTKVGVLATTDAWGQGLVDAISISLTFHNASIVQQLLLPQGLSSSNISRAVQEFRNQAETSVNVLIALRDDAVKFIQAIIEHNMVGPGWTWLATDGIVTNTDISRSLLISLNGMLGVRPISIKGSLNTVFHNFPDRYGYTQLTRDASVPSFAARLFDAVTAAQLAANKALSWNGTTQDRRLTLVNQLRSYNSISNGFPAASQDVIFFDANQDGPAFYDIVNVVNGEYLEIATVEAGKFFFDKFDQEVVWSGINQTGFSNCPSQIPPVERVSSDSNVATLVIVVVILAIIVFAVIVTAGVVIRRSRTKLLPHDFAEDLKKTGLGQPELLLPPQELRRANLNVGDKLGTGHFGVVRRGELDQSADRGLPRRTVAVKMCHEYATAPDVCALLREAAYMAQFQGHNNVVNLIGVVTRGSPVYVVMEYCEHGSLDRYLRNFQRVQLSVVSKIRMGMDIVEGMHFISSKGAIHRDLACRNVLVTRSFTCKITDFGLARNQQFYTSSSVNLPVKWTAPEALSDGKFSSASDVWAFGITMCEIFLNGGAPYPGQSNDAVRVGICCGDLRHQQVCGMPDSVYTMLQHCWAEEPCDRPTFAELRSNIIQLLRLTNEFAVNADFLRSAVADTNASNKVDDSIACVNKVPKNSTRQTKMLYVGVEITPQLKQKAETLPENATFRDGILYSNIVNSSVV